MLEYCADHQSFYFLPFTSSSFYFLYFLCFPVFFLSFFFLSFLFSFCRSVGSSRMMERGEGWWRGGGVGWWGGVRGGHAE